MAWLQLKFKTDEELADNISACLSLLGAVAVTFASGDRQEILEPDLDSMPLWNHVKIVALFNPETNLPPILNFLYQQFGQDHIQDINHELLADQQWEKVWLQDFHPMQFGENLWVCPRTTTPPNPNAATIFLDPGLAFGTGTHPTTALCLQWLAANPPLNKTVIDYGCGSGILAIAAAKLGAKEVYAIDHDPQALEATLDNARQNAINLEHFHILAPEMLSPVQANLIIANILANPLIELCAHFVKLMQTQGQIVLSGITKDQEKNVLTTYAKYFKMNQATIVEDWVRLDGTYL